MVTLADLGFQKNNIYETIACTFNPDGTANAAPMGATEQATQKISLTIYNSASTLENLKTTKAATLNLTGDIDIFYQAALKTKPLPAGWFEKSGVNAPKLKMADAVIEFEVIDFVPVDAFRTKVLGDAKGIDAPKVYPQAYCRAKSAVLEAIIHATRIKVLADVKDEQEKLAKLCSLIQNCSDVVKRSAPNSHYAELMADLQQKIALWRSQP
jgi:hypothetical protein